MTEAMLFLQKTILLSYDPRPFRAGLMFEFVPHQKAPPFAGELSVRDSEQTEGGTSRGSWLL